MKRVKLLNKDTLFKIHGWIGMKLSILLFVVCFSGTLAVFSHEMDWLFIPEMRAEPAQEYASWNRIVKNVNKAYPSGKITFWRRAREPYLADLIYVQQGKDLKYVFANPYTGEVQGSAEITFQRFFRDLHYFLYIPFQVGHFIVLFFAFVIFITLLTGMLYYKDWYKKLFHLKTGKGSAIFYSSLHKLVGAWSIPFMFLISSTGIWYFIERTDFPKISSYMDEDRPSLANIDAEQYGESLEIDYDFAAEVAQQAIPGLEVKGIYPPRTPEQSLYMTGTSNTPLVRYRANRVYLNPYTFEVMKVQQADKINTINWLNDIVDPLHFGYWGGIASKLVWFFMGLGLSSLILTGPWLYLKRRIKQARLQKERSLVHG